MSNPTTISSSPAVESPAVIPTNANPGGCSGHTFNNWPSAQEYFNDRFAYIRTADIVVRFEDLQIFKPEPFVKRQFSNYTYRTESKVEVDGETKVEFTYHSVADRWLSGKERNQYEKMTYAPGKLLVYKGDLNRWRGMGSEAKQGNIAPWNEMLDYLFPNAPEQRKYFEQSLAYPIQHLGTKMKSAVVLYSRMQRLGKNSVAEAVGNVYGLRERKNAIVIGEDDLYARFNGWQKDMQFIIADEVQGGHDKYKVAERLKTLISSTDTYVEEKFLAKYTIPNCANYIFLTNHPDAFYIAAEDRRFWIWEIPQESPLSPDFYKQFHEWKDSPEGIAALYWHLLHVDMKDFNPHGHAPMTAAKEDAVELSRTDLQRWLRELPYEEPSRFLYTADELLSKWREVNSGEGHSWHGQTAIGKALTNLGYKQANPGNANKQVKINRKPTRLWVVALPDKIEDLKLHDVKPPDEWARLYQQGIPGNAFFRQTGP